MQLFIRDGRHLVLHAEQSSTVADVKAAFMLKAYGLEALPCGLVSNLLHATLTCIIGAQGMHAGASQDAATNPAAAAAAADKHACFPVRLHVGPPAQQQAAE